MEDHDIAEFLEWRRANSVITDKLSSNDLVKLFPILESYAEFRLKNHYVAATSSAERAFSYIHQLEREVQVYRENSDIANDIIDKRRRFKVWRWWMISRDWWRLTRKRWRIWWLYWRVLFGLLRRDYATGRRSEWARNLHSLPKRKVRRIIGLRTRWEMLLLQIGSENRWEKLRHRTMRNKLERAIAEEERKQWR